MREKVNREFDRLKNQDPDSSTLQCSAWLSINGECFAVNKVQVSFHPLPQNRREFDSKRPCTALRRQACLCCSLPRWIGAIRSPFTNLRHTETFNSFRLSPRIRGRNVKGAFQILLRKKPLGTCGIALLLPASRIGYMEPGQLPAIRQIAQCKTLAFFSCGGSTIFQ